MIRWLYRFRFMRAWISCQVARGIRLLPGVKTVRFCISFMAMGASKRRVPFTYGREHAKMLYLELERCNKGGNRNCRYDMRWII